MDDEAIIEVVGGVRRLTIKVLDENSSGIYVCVAKHGEKGGDPRAQSVVLLKSGSDFSTKWYGD